MKRAPRSRQRHDLYAKYHDYDSEISDLLGECGFKSDQLERTVDKITSEGVAASATQIIPRDNIIVPTRMAVGKAAINKIDMAINQDLKALFPSEHVDLRFLLNALLANAPVLEQQATGATVKGIKLDVLRNLEIPLPPLAEQKRIAAILDQAARLTRLRAEALARLDTLGQAIFHEMFDGKELPSAPLKMLGAITTGSTPSTSEPENFFGNIPFITPGDLESNREISRFLSEAGAKASRLVKPGAAMVCCIGATIGKMGMAEQVSAFNQQINSVQWNDKVLPVYGYFALRTMRSEIERQGKGAATTLPILKKSLFQEICIPVAPLNAQGRFNDIFKTIASQLPHQRNALASLQTLFASLQHRAFRGEL